MTDINSQDDFLRALDENPHWREAVRALILSEEVLQLPVRFTAYMIRTDAFMEQAEAFLADLLEFNRQQAEFNPKVEGFMEGQAEFKVDALTRIDRLESDIGRLNSSIAKYEIGRNPRSLVREVADDLQYVDVVSPEEMDELGEQAIAAGLLSREERRSFTEADLVIEATDGAKPCYLAVEVANTANRQDAERARRNAQVIAELKGCNARPVIVSLRNDDEVDGDIQAGLLAWYQVFQ